MRWVLIAAFVVHGALHLIGVFRQSGFAQGATGEGLALPTGFEEPWLRGAWLLGCLLLLASAGLLVWRLPQAWLVAGLALVVSQALIFSQWGEAKAGSLVNLLLMVVVATQWADARFAQRTRDEAASLLASATRAADATPVRAEALQALPAPIRRWLESAGVVGKPRVQSVRLRQSGGLRTAPSQAFMPAQAQQYFSVEPPGFVWQVHVPMARVIPVVGRDSYLDGHGHMLIKALGLIPVVDAEGSAIDQGVLLRFLAEMVWFPGAALAPYVVWTALDDTSARATMRYRDVSASADFHIDERGRFARLQAQRYMSDGGGASLQDWSVSASAWRRFQGVEVPSAGSVSWLLPEGEFTYYRWEINELEYNVSELYE